MADVWGGAWGTSWGVSWGAVAAVIPPTPLPDTSTHGGIGVTRPVDYEERRRIADEVRALYAEIYDRRELPSEAEAVEEVAALVATWAPVSAPDLPPPAVIDWAGMIDDAEFILRLTERLSALQAMRRENEDITLLLLAM